MSGFRISRFNRLRIAAILAAVIWGISVGAGLPRPQREDIMTLASSRPCLATALLYVTANPMESANGTLRFDGIPTQRSVRFLLAPAGDADSNDMVSAWNPYGDPDNAPAYMVEIQWKFVTLGRGSYLLSSRAQIVDGDGQPLVRQHIIEPLTSVFVAGDSFRIVDNGKTL
jgi:hypothetical protein